MLVAETRTPEWAMTVAALVLALDVALLAHAAVLDAPVPQRIAFEPVTTGTGPPRAARSSHREPWDEDRTMGRYPDQNPFHVPGET
jgi:hypothetical protein